MSRYAGLFTFDIDTHKYIPIIQAKEILNLQKEEEMAKERMKNEQTLGNI